MPIDYQQIYEKIQEIGRGARERRKTMEERRKKARELLDTYASDLDFLRRRVESAKEIDANIRCAYPLTESLASSHPTPDASRVIHSTLIAADGSQISPDRNSSIQYCLTNVGSIALQSNSGNVPEISTKSELLLEDEWEEKYGPATDGMIALIRDFKERSKLEEEAKRYQRPVVTITDGPLELWEPKSQSEARAFDAYLNKYLGVLSRMQDQGIIATGYIDKPAENLAVRLLEIASATPDEMQRLRDHHPLRGVSDRWLYGERETPLLLPGHRSAVFRLQSGSEKKYTGVLSLHFFYLNVGTKGHPWPVRVEVPKWVVDDKEKLDLLHGVLVSQCRMMGSRPYPYLLHRAHEVAVVKQEEKQQVEQLLTMELRRNNEEIDDGSYKQSAKDLKGRTRK